MRAGSIYFWDAQKGTLTMRKVAVIMTVMAGLALSACNTIGGLGRDIQSAGDTIEDAAT
jgi:predicted small secreted protein